MARNGVSSDLLLHYINNHHNITEILLKVALSTIKQTNRQTNLLGDISIIGAGERCDFNQICQCIGFRNSQSLQISNRSKEYPIPNKSYLLLLKPSFSSLRYIMAVLFKDFGFFAPQVIKSFGFPIF